MSNTIPTVKVQAWGKGQGEFVEINECDFDAKLHKPWADPLDHDANGKKGGSKPAKKAKAEETAGNPPLTRREIEADLTAMGEDFNPAADLDELRRVRDEARAILEA